LRHPSGALSCAAARGGAVTGSPTSADNSPTGRVRAEGSSGKRHVGPDEGSAYRARFKGSNRTIAPANQTVGKREPEILPLLRASLDRSPARYARVALRCLCFRRPSR
jgi:hypothetical protein